MSDLADVALYLPKQLNRRLRKLAPEVRELTMGFFGKFSEDYRRNAIHLEPIRHVKDRRLRSARLNQAWRAILLQADDHEFVLLDVAPHDEAYRRVGVISWGVNPTFANFEVSYLDEIDTPPSRPGASHPRPADAAAPSLFDPYTAAQLTDLGIRAELLPALRPLTTEEQVLALADGLDDRIAQIVVDLAAGVDYETVMDQITKPGASRDDIDVSDLKAALAHPASQITSTDAAVAAMLDADFEDWQVFLHPLQRKIVDQGYRGPARVSGGPGTGKTVVALHRAARLARALPAGSDQRILLTTYNKRLKSELERRLAKLLEPEAFERVLVTNIDRLGHELATRHCGVDRRPIWDEDELARLWQDVLDRAGETDLSARFLVAEWKEVILAGMITSRSAYLAAERTGRGTRLGRVQRARIWEMTERFLTMLTDRGLWADAQYCMVAALAESANSWTGRRRFQHVVIDEAQDLKPVHWRLIRELCAEGDDDLFIAGDTYQRIYQRPFPMAPLGIDIKGRSRNLTLSYRTTKQILQCGIRVMEQARPDEHDEEPVSLSGYRSVVSGAEPLLLPQSREADEVQAAVQQVKSWIGSGAEPNSIVVCMPTGRSGIERYVAALEAAGIPAVPVHDEAPLDASVHVTTINNLKGSEYHHVALAGVGAKRFPRRFATDLAETDPVEHRLATERERNLLFVALTRASRELAVIWTGEPSPLLGLREIEG
jgi:superfamily I DNA/RNA helicase